MKAPIVIAALLFTRGAIAQCSYSATLTSSSQCVGVPLTVNTVAILSQISWNQNGNTVLLTKAVSGPKTGITIAGDPSNHGSSSSELNNPIGLGLDGGGNVYVVDRLNYRIQKYVPGATDGITVAGGNGQGSGASQLSDPIGIYVDPSGNVFVADFGNSRVQKWTVGASNGVTVAGGNGQGPALDQLSLPSGVFVDGNGNVFVADAGNNRIIEWAPGATTGVIVAGGNGTGSAANQLNYPTAVFVDPSGNVFVTDEKNNRVQKWTPGATTGVTVAGGNGAGSAPNQLNTPFSLFVDKAGDIYVDDQVNARIQFWPNGATAGITVAGGNGGGVAANQLFEPTGVYVDPNGIVYIADYGNNRVQKWATLSNIANSYTPSAPGSYSAVTMDYNGCPVTTNTIVVQAATSVTLAIHATDTILCGLSPVTYSATATGTGTTPQYQWKLNGLNAGTDSTGFTNLAPANGDLVMCMLTSNAQCAQPSVVTSDPIHIRIIPAIPLAVSISADATSICAGMPAHFTATPATTTNALDFQWEVNGKRSGTDSSGLTVLQPANGDQVQCILTSPSSCLTASSTPLAITVNATPQVFPTQAISLLRGQDVILEPTITGDIATYRWSPPTGLSDDAIRDPTASPTHSITYTLRVVATDGCAADGTITVKVAAPIRIPDAFTPNGDGRNDVFYVLGGPDGSVIRDLAVFSRSGQRVFHVHDAPPGDPAFGWNGMIAGSKAQTGNYVYVAVIALADGSKEVFKGSLLLMR